MKIKSVKANNRKRAFEVVVRNGREFTFPYSQLSVKPSPENKISEVAPDKDIGNEGFTYVLQSGETDTVHIDHVLHYVQEPGYVRDLTARYMSIRARNLVESGEVSKNEILRRLKTSASQLDRMLDPSTTTTSIDKLLELLVACECRVELTLDGENVMDRELEPA